MLNTILKKTFMSNSAVSGKSDINKGVGINVYALDNSTWKKIIFDKSKLVEGSNKQIDLFTSKYLNMGKVTGISDNIVSIVGLFNVKYGEMISVSFGTGNAVGMVLNIEEDSISAIIFSSDIILNQVKMFLEDLL